MSMFKANIKKTFIQFVEKHLMQQRNWSKIVFSDEKKFNFSGPYSTHDLLVLALSLKVK